MSAPTTKVKVHITTIKFFDPKINSVNTHKVLGKMTVINCKKLTKQLNKDNIFIEKNTTLDQFSVDTKTLYDLKP